MEIAASTSDTFKSSIGSELQTPNIITSDQAAQNGEKIKEEEEYDIDHDHLLLPWACCIPIVLDNFEAKQASYDHYSFFTYSLLYQHYALELLLFSCKENKVIKSYEPVTFLTDTPIKIDH